MAYEAMNNAGARQVAADRRPQRQRHVDRPAGRRDERLSVAGCVSVAALPVAARHAGEAGAPSASRSRSSAPRKRAEEYARGMLTGGTLFEELGFYYVGPIDGHDLDHLLPVLRNLRDTDATSPILLHVVTQKGKGYAPAEAAADKYHGVVKFNVVTGAQARRRPNAPSLHQGLRQRADRARPRRDDQHRRHHRGDAVRHRARPVRQALPQAQLRRRHRRAARRHLRRRHGGREAEAVLRDLLDLPAARLRPGRARRRDAAACRCASPSTAPAWSAPMAPTHAGSFDVAYLGCLPGYRADGGRRRGRADAHGRDRRRHRRPARRPSAIRAARASAWNCPSAARRSRSAAAAIVQRGHGGRASCPSARGCGECLKAAEELGAPRPLDHRRRRPLRQAAGHRRWSSAWRASTRC